MVFDNQYILICGASSGIGLGFVTEILDQHKPQKVYATYRSSSNLKSLNDLKERFPETLQLIEFDALNEDAYTHLKSKVEKVDVILNAIGVLHEGERLQPERKLEELQIQAHMEVYKTNTLPTLLLSQFFKEDLKNSESPAVVSVSAKVGSIGDNKMGGWYSYRISKAALNMAIKNLAIEFKRLNKNSLFIAIHPGTTETKLSEPFMSGARKKYKIHSSDETAQNILKVLSALNPQEHSGEFFSWDGEKLPW